MAYHPRDPFLGSSLNRRQFLRRSMGAAVALPSLGAILAACGEREQTTPGGGQTGPATGGGPTGPETPGVQVGTPSNPVEQPLFDDNPAIASGLEPEAGPLRIYNWADYLWPRVYKRFAEEFGVEVELTTFYNMEEAFRKLQTGELQVDVFFPTSENVGKIVAGKLLQPLNRDYLPNLQANVWPSLSDPFYDKGSRYTVPYTVYQTGIGWRTDMVDSADVETSNPWDVFWNTKYAGITGLYDDFEETLAATMARNGVADPFEAGEAEISAAADDLVEAINTMNLRFTIDGAYAKLPEGKFGLHHAWSGDMVATPYYFPKGDDPAVARYAWPPNVSGSTVGGLIGNDCLAIVRGAQSPVLAHAFLNFMLDETNAVDNFGWVGYQPPQVGLDPDGLVADGWVAEWLASAIVRQDDFDKPLAVIPRELRAEVEVMWLDAWSRVQAG